MIKFSNWTKIPKRLVLAAGLILTGCSAVSEGGPERVLNLGTSDAPAFSTTGGATPSVEATFVSGRAAVPQSAIDKVYNAHGRSPLWGGSKSWAPAGKAAHQFLRDSWSHGLQPNSYLPQSLKRLGRWSPEMDMAITAGLIKYISDLSYGRTKSNFGRAADDLVKFTRSGSLSAALRNAAPQGHLYQRLHQTAARSLKKRGATTPNFIALEETMEQLRLRPTKDFRQGTTLVVNIAAFDLQVWDGGQQVLGSKVIVGQEGRDTPIGPDRIKSLKFSPDWTAPRSIIERDLFPKLKENPADFGRFGMEVSLNGKRIQDPTSVDWNKVSASSVSIRQAPGKDNVLGGVRFTLGNSNAIYLHDTANKNLYRKLERASSSGCVRVAKAEELAHWILAKNGKNWSMDKVKNAMDAGETSYVTLKKSIPVEMVYYTAWIDNEGALSLSRDLYNKNAGLRAQISVN